MALTQEGINSILEIGVALSSESNYHKLLDDIIVRLMQLTHCDGGTLYLLQKDEQGEDRLAFMIMRTDSKNFARGGDGKPTGVPPMALKHENVCAFSYIEGRTVVIEDVYESEEFNFQGPRNYDKNNNYRTKSMLVVPLKNRAGEKLGVIQLINAMDAEGNLTAFDPDLVLAVESVSSQAAITIQNARYIEDIKALFQSFVDVMITAIDERTPYNASHTRHMSIYGDRFIDYLNQLETDASRPPLFDPRHKDEFIMSVKMHDIGKLTTPLEVMNKMARLTPEQHTALFHRLEVIHLLGRIAALDGTLSADDFAALNAELDAAKALIEKVNTVGFLQDDLLAEITALKEKTYVDETGATKPWILEDEFTCLTIRKGTLLDSERKIMENHVVVTEKLLEKIKFSSEYAHVKQWASSHHELLNGSGYPRGLKGDEIPFEVRILSILDVFDALVADDRPYKPGMPIEKALGILGIMAEKEGKLDPELVELFVRSQCWLEPETVYVQA